MTRLYNRFHNPDETSEDIRELRRLHAEMDQAVASAYGWRDLDLGHGFHETKQGLRYTISEPARREVLDRLLALNHERYEEEVRQGLHEKGKKKTRAGRRPKARKASAAPSLFDQLEAASHGPDARSPRREAPAGPSAEPAPPPPAEAAPASLDSIGTDEVMAAFRQAARGRGMMTREELLKEVSGVLGYQRLGSRIEEALRNHLRAAIRRKIIGTNGGEVWIETPAMENYSRDELVEAIRSVMRKGVRYERREVMRAVADHLGFQRLRETVEAPIRSAINGALRRGILAREGSLLWREM